MSKSLGRRNSTLPQRVKADGSLKSLATPQSVRKSRQMPLGNSAASNQKISFFGNSVTRHSSQYGAAGGSEKVKDTRPLHDKGFQQRTVKSLCEFLSEHDCPLVVSPRELQAPSTKLYLRIFEFMCRFLDPDYSLPSSKVDEEVPRLFKEFGYPFTLSKSAMYTVGAPHTWPHILGATLWLMEHIKMTMAVSQSISLFPPILIANEEEKIAYMERKIHFDNTCSAYNRFMEGNDDFTDEDRKINNNLKELYKVDEDQQKALEAENERLEAELQYLLMEKEKAPDRLQALKLEKSKLLRVVLQTQSYVSDMQAHCQVLDQKIARSNQEMEDTASELLSTRKETERLEEIYARQEMTPADVQRLRCEEKELQAMQRTMAKECEHSDKQCWDMEMSLHRMRERVGQQHLIYQDVARKLQLMPATSENAGGKDLDFSLHFHEQPGQAQQHFLQVVKPMITSLIGKIKNQIQTSQSQIVMKNMALEQVLSLISDREKDIKKLEFQLRVLEDNLSLETEAFEREERRHRQEIEDLAQSHSDIQKHVDDGVQEAMDECKKLEAIGKENMKQMEIQRHASHVLLGDATLAIYKHFTFFENLMEDFKQRVQAEYETECAAHPLAKVLRLTPAEQEMMAIMSMQAGGLQDGEGQQEEGTAYDGNRE
uniref:Kinetochore protein NDC80 n=1 Tax=Petromyzon marinus TaxID=7757 RepID=A0AAJ7UCP7_PETMA|nr:kinetochore protein NDC80 homolog [Petromyzon marinus]